MPVTTTNNISWINNLRLIALYAIIIVHTTAPLLETYNKGPLSAWLVADFYNSLVRFGVPVFVMITGALLLHKEYEIIDFLKKRLFRVVVPFLFWSLIYVAYMYYNEDIEYPGDFWLTLKQVLHFLKYGSSYHLWYVYMLIGLYLIIPIIGKFVRNASNNEVLYFLIVWFIVMLVEQPWLSRYKLQVDLHYFEGFIGYLVLGHYLVLKQDTLRQYKYWLIALFFISLACCTIGTYLLYKHFNGISTYLYEPLSPSIFVISATIFLLAIFIVPKVNPFIIRIRDFAGQYAYGIYLSHALVLMLLDQWGISYRWFAPMLSIPVTAFICMILSLGLVYIISKIPYGKYVSG